MYKKRPILLQKLINFGYHLPLAWLASTANFFPSKNLKIIGVTGTDGKTTTVNLIYHLLAKANLLVGMISTVSAKIGKEEIDTGLHVTVPNPSLLQKILKEMKNKGLKYVVLEVTSHGLDQFRVFGIKYEIGVLTNITLEHLDYHGTFENYREAKLKLFLNSKTAILNKDDNSFDFLKSKLEKRNIRIVTYGIKNDADFAPAKFPFKTNLSGEYNQYNCLAAIATAITLGIDPQSVREGVLSFEGVVGRMEEIKMGQKFKVFVDFAHTPNALRQVLEDLRSQTKKEGKLWVVFGSAGERDKQKRPKMGEVAGSLADQVVLTAEDPRSEKAEDICQQIEVGCQKVGCQPIVIPDRSKAINYTIKEAKSGDIVVICGKGHEKSMRFGETEYPWSDQEEAREAIRIQNQEYRIKNL